MKNLSKIIGIPLICLSLLGCGKALYETGEVIQEKKVDPSFIKINGTEIKAGEKAYILRVKTKQGEIYTLDITDGYYQSIEALEECIKEGDIIQFRIGNEYTDGSKNITFTESNIGKIDGDQIKLSE